jgi:hypothetical protein
MERLFPDGGVAVPGDDPRRFTKYFLNIFADFKPEDTRSAEAAQAFGRHMQTMSADQAPTARCFPAGIPMATVVPPLRRLIQTPACWRSHEASTRTG